MEKRILESRIYYRLEQLKTHTEVRTRFSERRDETEEELRHSIKMIQRFTIRPTATKRKIMELVDQYIKELSIDDFLAHKGPKQ